jgi:hypothetical protein
MIDEILAHKGVLMKVNEGVAEFYKAKTHEQGYTEFEEGPSIENLLKMRMEEVNNGLSPMVGSSETHSERAESRARRECEGATPAGVLKEEAERQAV